LVLREFEEMSYSLISTVAETPMGTVMSRLKPGPPPTQMVSFEREAKEIL
jgi:hypothetical protein